MITFVLTDGIYYLSFDQGNESPVIKSWMVEDEKNPTVFLEKISGVSIRKRQFELIWEFQSMKEKFVIDSTNTKDNYKTSLEFFPACYKNLIEILQSNVCNLRGFILIAEFLSLNHAVYFGCRIFVEMLNGKSAGDIGEFFGYNFDRIVN